MSIKSLILVCLQITTMCYLLLKTPIIYNSIWLILQILGIAIALWGILTIQIGNFNIQPEVKSNSLITKGPYKIIRNPMYTGIIFIFLPIVIKSYNTINVSIYILLIITLLLKIFSEEHFLEQKFGTEYKLYKKSTYRLFPYIF